MAPFSRVAAAWQITFILGSFLPDGARKESTKEKFVTYGNPFRDACSAYPKIRYDKALWIESSANL
jgi:hypothetical protein